MTCKEPGDTDRRAAADRALEHYDFGGAVEATDGWESLRPGRCMTRRVYLANEETPESATVACWFTVVFQHASADVAEAYAINEHGNVFGRLAASGDDASAFRCLECGERDCPGVVTCPACGTDDHGADAFTHIADHGRCWSCHKHWQLQSAPSEVVFD